MKLYSISLLFAAFVTYSGRGLAAGPPPTVQALQQFIENRLSERPLAYENGEVAFNVSAGEDRFCGARFLVQQRIRFPENCVLVKQLVGKKITFRAAQYRCYTSRRTGIESCSCEGQTESTSPVDQKDTVDLASIASDLVQAGRYIYRVDYTNVTSSRNVTLYCANEQDCVKRDLRTEGKVVKEKTLSIATEGARDEPDVLRAISDLAKRCSKEKTTPNPYRK